MGDFSQMNVYEMYMDAKDKQGGAWIRRTTWANLCARIKSVGKITGPAPYFGNPEVRADLYTLDGRLHQSNAVIPSAGTYKTWRQFEVPTWWTEGREQ